MNQGGNADNLAGPGLFDQYSNEVGLKLAKDFAFFLKNFALDQSDPNYDQYADDIIEEDQIDGQIQEGQPIYYYKRQAQKMLEQDKMDMHIDYTHVAQFNHQDTNLPEKILQEFHRYEPYLRKGLTIFMNDGKPMAQNQKRLYQVGFYNLAQINKIRDLKTTVLGRLMAIYGTVTRTTDTKPELLIGSFRCKECQEVTSNIEQQFKYTEPNRCANEKCYNQTQFELINQESIFIDWQKLRVQEHSTDIPAGSMPRSVDVILRDEICEMAKPGDRTIFTGHLVVVPDIVQMLKPGEKQTTQSFNTGKMARNPARTMDGVSGIQKTGAKDLSYKLVFIACSVHAADSRFGFQNVESADDEEKEENGIKQFTLAEQHEIMKMRDEDDLYTKLATSIAPTVFGHSDVKKGILLQLFGGIHKNTSEGIKLRGDINICIVGDPSTAKSQFLKYICSFLPRSVYTSGKASSAAGLTASVSKDPETGEYCIEAGALMLADHGICCIDEFDKMDVKDQVAIHEAMEQQTISIAKAGIHATLNARASILAAANPILGRYDRGKSLRYNVDISAPIMSRFDLFFVIFDEKNDEQDFHIASHIVNMHRLREESLNPDFTTTQLQTYIKFARQLKPQFTKESAQMLKQEYIRIRQSDNNNAKTSYKVTVRQLESLIRQCEAMARAHLDRFVRPAYVKEVCRLLRASNINIVKSDIEFDQEIQVEMNQAQQMRQQDQSVLFNEVKNGHAAAQNGQKQEQAPQTQTKKVQITFEEYQKLSIMILNVMKEFERENQENVQQSEIVNKMVRNIEVEGTDRATSVERSMETSRKIQNVIQHLITKESVLMVSQDSKVKNERYLCLNINVDLEKINLGGQSS